MPEQSRATRKRGCRFHPSSLEVSITYPRWIGILRRAQYIQVKRTFNFRSHDLSSARLRAMSLSMTEGQASNRIEVPIRPLFHTFVPLKSDRYFSGGTHWKSSEGQLAMGKCCTLRVSLGSPNHQSLSTAQESTKPPSIRSSRRCNATSRWLNMYAQQTNPLPCHIYGAPIPMSRIYSSIPKSPPKLSESYTNSQAELARLVHHARQPYFPEHDGPPFRGLGRPRLPDNTAQLSPEG